MQGSREIPLTQGLTALVDSEDYERISQYRWYASWRQRNRWYAQNDTVGSMHRFVIGAVEGEEVDHKNMVTLDNRKSNLRIVTPSQQRANQKIRADSTNNYKGIKRHGNRFSARIGVNGKVIHLGMFSTDVEAAQAYDQAARLYYGEHARTNF